MQIKKCFILAGYIVPLIACSSKEQAYIPQKEEVVTWKQNPELIVKTQLGPHREHYLGPFPIDDIPENINRLRRKKQIDCRCLTLIVN